MAQTDELRLMTKVARLYHERGLKQQEIAEQLSLSQSTVSRLLDRARRERIVRVSVTAPPGTFPDLEDAVAKRYGLKDVIVADTDADEEPTRKIGSAAAFYLESTLKSREVIGISSWSDTLLAMVEAMHPFNRQTNALVVQILGGIGNPAAEVHANRLSDRLATLVNGNAHFLPAPGVVGAAESVAVLMRDPYIQEAIARFQQVTLALVGIGAVEPSPLLKKSGNVFSDEELDMLRRHGAVGDICLRFFDERGRPVVTPLDARVVGMRLEDLRHVERSVAVAGGERKHKAIRSALLNGWVNVLITDRQTGEYLMAGAEEGTVASDGADR